jgi:uncharacterized repeat protein (TIGR03806 family)
MRARGGASLAALVSLIACGSGGAPIGVDVAPVPPADALPADTRPADTRPPDALSPDAGPPLGLDRRPPNPRCAPPARSPDAGAESPPERLGQTGCFDPSDPTRPDPALIPYAVNAPLWSDGADKQRWLALPDGARITVRPDGDWELPPGSVLIKTFSFGARRIETRFFVRHREGDWSGYTYQWNEAGTDAVLLAEGSHRERIGAEEWHFPSRAQCQRCHTAAAGHSLGLETAQLNRAFAYPGGRVANQLATWTHIGLFEQPPGDPSTLPALADPADAQGAPEARARAYLHGNCAPCHRPGLEDAGSMDLRFATPLAATMACGAEPQRGTLGIGPQVRLIAPGRPDLSSVLVRMRALDSNRMPTVASLVVDSEGSALIEAWIRALGACPTAAPRSN